MVQISGENWNLGRFFIYLFISNKPDLVNRNVVWMLCYAKHIYLMLRGVLCALYKLILSVFFFSFFLYLIV